MKAMVLHEPLSPLVIEDITTPRPGPGQVLVRVLACAVCRTDLHIVDGDLPFPGHPVIPGHEIIGIVEQTGAGITEPAVGTRIGIPWLGHTCGSCSYCTSGRENLCDDARFTGYHMAGGFAQYTVADAHFCFPIPESYQDIEAAPLLCAGLIGYRALRLAGPADRLGLYGFGAAAHILIQIALHEGRTVYALTRPGRTDSQQFARQLGATWAGDSDQLPPQPLDAAIIFAPAGHLVIKALQAVRKGGIVVCAGIHMSDIPSFAYRLLWGERKILSVANLTRQDGTDFFTIAPRVPVRTTVTPFGLEQANEALAAIRQGNINGAAVLVI